jgi:hypothetical protein
MLPLWSTATTLPLWSAAATLPLWSAAAMLPLWSAAAMLPLSAGNLVGPGEGAGRCEHRTAPTQRVGHPAFAPGLRAPDQLFALTAH